MNVPQQEVGSDPPRGIPFDQRPIFVPTPNLKHLFIVDFAPGWGDAGDYRTIKGPPL
jgi:hypothetical protein